MAGKPKSNAWVLTGYTQEFPRFPDILGEDVHPIHCGRWISSLRGILVRSEYRSRHCYRFSHQNYCNCD